MGNAFFLGRNLHVVLVNAGSAGPRTVFPSNTMSFNGKFVYLMKMSVHHSTSRQWWNSRGSPWVGEAGPCDA